MFLQWGILLLLFGQLQVNVNSTSTENNSGLQPLEKVVQKLHEIDQVRKCAEKFTTVDLSNEDPLINMKQLDVHIQQPNKTIIENIDSNSAAVFQTLLNGPVDTQIKREEFMKTEVFFSVFALKFPLPIITTCRLWKYTRNCKMTFRF